MFHNFISLPAFIISFAIGFLFIYLWGPDVKTIIAYPTPDNSGKIQYHDQAENCFSYEAVETTCPSDESLINTIPMQENNIST